MHPEVEHMNLCFDLEKLKHTNYLCFDLEKLNYRLKTTDPFFNKFNKLAEEYNRKNQLGLELEEDNPQYK